MAENATQVAASEREEKAMALTVFGVRGWEDGGLDGFMGRWLDGDDGDESGDNDGLREGEARATREEELGGEEVEDSRRPIALTA